MIPDDKKQSFIDELFPLFSIVLLIKGKEVDIGGNGVVIAPNIAITSAHILLNNRFESFSDLNHSPNVEKYYPEESLNISINSVKYKATYILNVERTFIIDKSDLAILYLSDTLNIFPRDLWNDIKLSLTPPNIGDHVFTIGSTFKDTKIDIIDGILNFNPDYAGSFGEVSQFTLDYRKRGPGFWANLTAPNTLSGSPVFNKDKELIGLICCGFSIEDQITFVSVLYPLFVNKFLLGGAEDRHLYKLAKLDIINCNDLDIIEIVGDNAINLFLPKYLENDL